MYRLLIAIAIATVILPLAAQAGYWQCVNRAIMAECNTWRWAVPGGWLVSTDNGDHGIAMVYYPDPDHKWML